ncbi:MAG: energy transducer TonB [Spirochaetaceae bacterium]|jgi:protein TonB|nr:energy transducer TonB [Spirochaetaceae bacterium]
MSAAPSPFHLPLNGERLSRVISVAVVAAVHVLLLFFLIFDIDVTKIIPDPPVAVMKLTDIQEYTPPPPLPPTVTRPVQNTVETIAEEIIGVEELEPTVAVSVSVETGNNTGNTANTELGYLPQHQVSTLPVFDQREVQNRSVYPPIAQRSEIEGNVILELFVDREGYVRNITVLKETPEGRGFAEAAIKAFQGMKATRPAQANGENVGIRYRRPVRFTLR